MPRHPQDNAEILKRAKASRERASATARNSTKLLHEAARLEESVRQAEEQLKELKILVGKTRKNASRVRRARKPSHA